VPTGLQIALGVVALETAGGAAAAAMLWRRNVRRKAAAMPATIAPQAAPEPAAAAPAPAPASAAEPPPPEIEDGREVAVTRLTLVWGRLGGAPEHYEVQVDTVSGDGLVFAGETRRLDAGLQTPERQLFHTLDLPQERLLAAHDATDAPIADMRDWLRALPRRVSGTPPSPAPRR
jgi:hypothetical protein